MPLPPEISCTVVRKCVMSLSDPTHASAGKETLEEKKALTIVLVSVHWDESILTVESIACRPWAHNAKCVMSTLGNSSTMQKQFKAYQLAMWDRSHICTCMYILIKIYKHVCRTHTIGVFAFKNSHNWCIRNWSASYRQCITLITSYCDASRLCNFVWQCHCLRSVSSPVCSSALRSSRGRICLAV